MTTTVDTSYPTVIFGYKIFNADWTCRDYQYKDPIDCGTTNIYNGDIVLGMRGNHISDIELGARGLHFCRLPIDCNRFYPNHHDHNYHDGRKYARVAAINDINDGSKVINSELVSVTNNLYIMEEISAEEWLILCTGRFVRYNLDGSISSEENYLECEKHGLSIVYRHKSDCGDVSIYNCRNYTHGKLDGFHTGWNDDGAIIYSYYYSNEGKDWVGLAWYKNGQKQCEVNIVNKEFCGEQTYWNKDGKITRKETYSLGVKVF